MTATLLTTLPPEVSGDAALQFARAARGAGAEGLELRSDLHAEGSINPQQLQAILPLLVSERVQSLPPDWLTQARWVDVPLDSPRRGGKLQETIVSHHAPAPLSPAEVVRHWTSARVVPEASIKHVEPLGPIDSAGRLLESQRLLVEALGQRRVTVLATGALALPFRALLAARNQFDYAAFGDWAAAEGQRSLEDAVRERRKVEKPRPSRRAILGSRLGHSRSPRIHAQPFDRIDLPADTNLTAVLAALLPHYDGLAITTPFKQLAARACASDQTAINTLVRRGHAWKGFNTDLAGARASLRHLGIGPLQVLGDGGATAAIRAACAETHRDLTILRRGWLPAKPTSGLAVWTWPAHIAPSNGLAFRECRVGIIAYGEPARRIAAQIRERGGTPVALGPTWFVAQAREQRQLWEEAR